MLLANEAAARLAKSQKLPFVYRVHAVPPDEKALRLAGALDRFGIPHPALDRPRAADYAKILENVSEHPLKSVVHQLVLRSMSKADYETEPVGHFGLALADYTHFTSPIRRYPDLAIHRILSAHIAGEKLKNANAFAHDAAIAGSMTEQRALQLERDCEDRYRAEFMRGQIGEEFTGMISGLTDFGIYVMLPNTAEGLVPTDALEPDEYIYDGFFTLTGKNTGVTYTIGETMRVKCVRADVGSGHIDFVPA
jgi:ribonuclease R